MCACKDKRVQTPSLRQPKQSAPRNNGSVTARRIEKRIIK
jgi:hypothetical protein